MTQNTDPMDEHAKAMAEHEKTMNELAETWFQTEHGSVGSWCACGVQLLRAAELVWNAYYRDEQEFRKRGENVGEAIVSGIKSDDLIYLHQHFIWAMLAGLALENMLKALFIAKIPPPEQKKDKTLDEKLKNHNLTKLAKQVKLPLSSEESDLVCNLSKFVEWGGRYPIPTKAQKMRPDQLPRIPAGDIKEKHDLFIRLCKRVSNELKVNLDNLALYRNP